jgi:hypothetical protein
LNKKLNFLFPFVFIISLLGFSQSGTIRGVILDDSNIPIVDVNVTAGQSGTTTNENGFYSLKIPANQDITAEFTHISYKRVVATFNLKNGEELEFHPVMDVNVEQISTVVISNVKRSSVEGITTLEPQTIRKIPGANPGIENLLKTLPGVSGNNELSTQYMVRGGNYDQNLVYVNGVEVYRPFLIRSGQQEGLSFTNVDLVQNVDFSAGGFQAKYGDKLASVLDVTYKKPVDFGATLDLSRLGASASVSAISKDSKLSGILGIRYRNNSLLVQAQQVETNYDPVFADIQTYITYNFTDKFQLGFLGNASLNQYNYEPIARQTNFGTLQNPLALLVRYQGQERDQYLTYFGALNATYAVNKHLTLTGIVSSFQTTEQEHYDILAEYRLGEVNTNIGSEDLGDVDFTEGLGSQLTHGRNDLDALITNVQVKADYEIEQNDFKFSIKYTNEDIRDRLIEYEVLDSAGFSINPPYSDIFNDEPYAPYEGPLETYNNVRAFNDVQIKRLQAYAQWSRRTEIGDNDVWINIGARVHNWRVSGKDIASSNQTVVSPRGQFAIKPNWEADMLFRVSGGLYYQPPFYRELRDSSGTVQPDVKAPKSVQIVLGHEYSFQMWERPFKLNTEIFYKNITDVNPYNIDNVRIRYQAKNNAVAYAYGLDLRLNGEFVPGTESWFTFGYLKTEENIDDRGYIARPTDQRLQFATMFQDYVPSVPKMKMYLNLVYNTGLPGGAPSYADPYQYQNRLPDYRRADVGFSYVIVDDNEVFDKGWRKPFKYFSVGIEIFNVFDAQNSITNTWVRDAYSKRQYAVPNYLTPRVFNIRTSMSF